MPHAKTKTTFVSLLGSVAVLTACGGGGSGLKTEVLEPTNPLLAGVYLSITAPSTVTGFIAKWVLSGGGGVIVVSKAQGREACSYKGKMTAAEIHANVPAAEAAKVIKYVGTPITIAVSGTSPRLAAVCRLVAQATGNGAAAGT